MTASKKVAELHQRIQALEAALDDRVFRVLSPVIDKALSSTLGIRPNDLASAMALLETATNTYGLTLEDCMTFYAVKNRQPGDEELINRAREIYAGDDDIDVDDNAAISRPTTDEAVDGPHKGAYVQLWGWVPKE